ncbi:DDE superfamily endonuclease [Phytophthora infestans]|uniref:DDE superfamily endonuclease n=1 Tax=Phytophthora infestans TaxID=4787 RepID=A0A833T4U7_PHYIN|nr:DDE superfamily endonuclease [Phytophthora infestans]
MPRTSLGRRSRARSLPLARLLLDEFEREEDIRAALFYPVVVERLLIPDLRFDPDDCADANALEDYRFTCAELKQLASLMLIPDVFITAAGDRVTGLEALAMLCYKLFYPGKLSRIRKQFGRSDCSCSRIITELYTIYFNDRIYAENHAAYVQAITNKTNGVVERVSMFIDGTKAFICRPGKRKRRILAMQSALDCIPVGDRENLQKVCYSGHKRRHCLNCQGVCTPDGTPCYESYFVYSETYLVMQIGLCISFFGPIEGRLHDVTMLSDSKLLPYLSNHPILKDPGIIIYGDPACGIDELLCSPFMDAHVRSAEKRFNTIMSKSRVSVEWMFSIIKQKWAFLDWNKKHKILLTPVGRMVRVAVLLTNASTCLRKGNQISEYFGCTPPDVVDYFRKPQHVRDLRDQPIFA